MKIYRDVKFQDAIKESLYNGKMASSAERTSANKDPEWYQPDADPLTKEETAAAAKEKIVAKYPEVVRTRVDPPIPNQSLALVSFMIFKEPKKSKNGKNVYGFMKNRGNWSDIDSATRESKKLIKEVDSKHRILHAPVGTWVPIIDDVGAANDVLDVRMDEKEHHLRDEAMKEKEAENRKIMRELREREEEVRDGDIYDDPTSLTYYSMRRVTEMRVFEDIEAKLKTIEKNKNILEQVRIELKRLENLHPEYVEQWIDRYNEERRKSGIPDFIPGKTKFADYEAYVPPPEGEQSEAEGKGKNAEE